MTELRKLNLGSGDLTQDSWGVQKMSLPKSLFHGMWTYDIPASMWFMYEGGTQVYSSTAITSFDGCALLQTSATYNDLLLESRECPRHQPNRGHLFSTALWCPTPTADGVREWGLLTTENGAFFRLKSDGLLYVVRRNAGVEVEVVIPAADIPVGFDVSKNNIYDIQYQWRSAGNYKFFIGDASTGQSKLVYTFNLLGTLTDASMTNPALPAAFTAVRATEDVSMGIGCVDITSENGAIDREQYNSAYSENVSISTNTPVIVIKQPLQIGGVTNTRTVSLARITVNSSKKGVFKVWSTRDPANITGATFVALGGGSFIETDSPDMSAGAVRATAVTIANCKFITSIPVEALVARSVDNPHRESIEFPLVRGDYLIITGTAATAIAECVVEWGEQI